MKDRVICYRTNDFVLFDPHIILFVIFSSFCLNISMCICKYRGCIEIVTSANSFANVFKPMSNHSSVN